MTASPVSVGIVADDLTGANDAAVQFARRGWQARLVLGGADAAVVDGGAVTAVVTDARAHTAERARSETSAAVAGLAASGVDHVFVKIDSTMRGTVSAQIDGSLDAWSELHPDTVAVVCPAYPAMGRTVEAGRLLVNGAGVQTTSVGRDPVSPVGTDALAELIPGSVSAVPDGSLSTRIRAAAEDGRRVISVDAATDADLLRIGEVIVELGERVIPVGSAGLAIVLADAWRTVREPAESARESAPVRRRSAVSGSEPTRSNGRVVVQVSSLHDMSRAQHAHLVSSVPPASVSTFAPDLADVMGADAATAWISARLESLGTLPGVVAVLAPDERALEDGASDLVAEGLAAITDAVVHHGDAATALVLMGGEGARAVLTRLGADAIRVYDAIREGVPIGIVDGGRAHGLTVVTKAGGFGVESSLTEIVPELAAGIGPASAPAPASASAPAPAPAPAPQTPHPIEPRSTP